MEDLETRVAGRINDSYLIARKSSELLDAQGRAPLATTQEVRQIAEQFLRNKGIDTTKQDEATGWDMFWAREMAAAMTAIPNRGGMYQTFLPGRFLHYDLLAHAIAGLFNGGEESIKGKDVINVGSGSSLGLMKLAEKGANVTALDSSIMALEFAKYLASHYKVSERATFIQRDYHNMPPEIKDKQFDVVYNSGVVEHERYPGGLIAQMAEIAKPGGYVVIAVPNEDSKFYRRFKDREDATKRRYPDLVRIPVEHRRHHPDIPQLMRESGLVVVRQDGLQVAPSSPIRRGDITKEDLPHFDSYLPVQPQSPSIENRVNAWTVLELYASRDLRMRYGWSIYYVGQKPIEPKPGTQ